MFLMDPDLVLDQVRQRLADADRSARARRIATARRCDRRAERATRRAARAGAAVW
ncbi:MULTISPECIES: hypothetical protein [unclassified Modestobacter]